MMDLKGFFISLLIHAVSKLTPQIKENLCKVLEALYKQAEKTQNPYDDMFIKALLFLLGCK